MEMPLFPAQGIVDILLSFHLHTDHSYTLDTIKHSKLRGYCTSYPKKL